MFKLPTEVAHRITAFVGDQVQRSPIVAPLVKKAYYFDDSRLRVQIHGLTFRNPVGLAAGFDKNAHLVDLFYLLGFGFTEVGSVTSLPHDGNPKPRLFRLLEDNGLINRMGLNSEGVEQVKRNLRRVKTRYSLGINITKSNKPEIYGDEAIEDICDAFKGIVPEADYITLNISCPNTPDGRTFEDPQALKELLSAIREKRELSLPIFIKVSPDLTQGQLEGIVRISLEYSMNGFVATNTSSKRENLRTSQEELTRIGKGGLSGPPIRDKSTKVVRTIYKLTRGRVPIIGCGGISTAEDAFEKIKAGASAVQLFTGLVYEGPGIATRINQGLIELLNRERIVNLHEAVGIESK